MKQTVNPVHLLYNNNRLHKHIVWAPCGEGKKFLWIEAIRFSEYSNDSKQFLELYGK